MLGDEIDDDMIDNILFDIPIRSPEGLPISSNTKKSSNIKQSNKMSYNETINDTDKLCNVIDFDNVSNKTLYDKLDEYKLKLINYNKKNKALEKVINEQKNKIRLLETKIIDLDEEIINNNNIIELQKNIIDKSRNINISMYNHIKQNKL